MKILFVADEFFAWGVYGGYGAFTRKLGGELVKRGIEVDAIVHRISDSQKPPGEFEIIDGVRVTTLPRKKLVKLRSKRLYETDADIIHSQSGMFDTYLAFKRNKNKKKIITFQVPRIKEEIKIAMQYETPTGYSWYKALWARYVHYLYSKAVKSADLITCQAKYTISSVKESFKLTKEPIWLPNMVDVPNSLPKKANTPTCLFLGRLDPIKRPEMFCELAKYFPQVNFYLLGSSSFSRRDEELRLKFKEPNIHFMGFDAGNLKRKLLEESWILVNTSVYECLPVSFLEACAHKCAILSTQNPDNFATNFGAWAKPSVSSLRENLNFLLENNRWHILGEKGYNYVKEFHSTQKVVSMHVDIYKQLLGEK